VLLKVLHPIDCHALADHQYQSFHATLTDELHHFEKRCWYQIVKKPQKNKQMTPTILERGLPIFGLRPNHVCEVSRCLFQLRI
jgi:hypothetical protein